MLSVMYWIFMGFMFMKGISVFWSKRKHLLATLLSLEFIAMSLFLMLFNYLNLFNYEFF